MSEEAEQTPDPFARVPAPLAAALRRRSFDSLTSVQEAVLAEDLGDADLRVSSQTGSGKTIAVGLLLGRMLVARERPAPVRGEAKPFALVIAPTRELAAQIAGELGWLLEDLRVKIATLTGGTALRPDFLALARSPDIVVGTPGRLVDHISKGSLKLDATAVVALDEADEMLDMGFRDDLEAILGKMPETRRTLMVSATFADDVLALANRYQRKAKQVEGSRMGHANADIEHVAVFVRPDDRPAALLNLLLLAPEDRTLVFVKTRADAADVSEGLLRNGFRARPIHGDMTQRERTATLDAFRAGESPIVVATDVAARGIDVPDITRVVHFDVPGSPDALTHRSGRTGRAGKKGTSIMLVPPAARMKLGRVLRDAGITATEKSVPTRADVERAQDARARAAIASLAIPEEKEARLRALARAALEGREPEDVVAALLARSALDGPCEPRDVATLELPRMAERPLRPARATAAGPGAANRGENPYVAWQVSWGAHDGADPRRLLAFICRRGGITSGDVGQMTVMPKSSIVEISRTVADSFHDAVARPDARDPHIRLRPLPQGRKR